MQNLGDFEWLFGLMITGWVVMFVLFWILWINFNKLQKKYRKIMGGAQSLNMEELLINLQESNTELHKGYGKQQESITHMLHSLKEMKGRIGIHRYNAFSETGSDLSFSVAILNDYKDGVVISGLHNREQMFIYAKPLVGGESKYALSPEEKEAINRSSLRD